MSSENISAVWIDQGGTCQDRILVRNGELQIEKHFQKQPLPPCDIVKKGTTIATNALLERQAPRILVITNQGLGDLLWIGDQRRAELFDPFAHRMALVDADVLEVKTRIDASGRLLYHHPLEWEDLAPYRNKGIVSVAIVFVHSHRNSSTEERVAQQCQDWGFPYVRMGHQIVKEPGFVNRLRSAAIDAALNPLLPRAKALYMRSDGGLADHFSENWSGVYAVLSGPAGGATAVSKLAMELGFDDVFGLDMGGTSADVCHFSQSIRMRTNLPFESWNIQVPTIDIETVAAGGGSILRVVDGVARVGPLSAGASPGPACYGRKGMATVCDCDAILGFLPVFPNVCGPNYDQPLDIVAAREALAELIPPTERTKPLVIERLAAQFQELAAEQMGNAILKMAAMRGVDPSTHSLVVFGGAGPAHACRVAQRLGMKRVIVPYFASVFSAFGIGQSHRQKHRMEPIKDGDIMAAYQRLQSLSTPAWGHQLHYRIRARYERTNGIIELDWKPDMDLASCFHRQHKKELGFARKDHRVCPMLLIRYDEERENRSKYHLPSKTMKKKVSVFLGDQWRDVFLYGRGNIQTLHKGPLLIELDGSMLLVPMGWTVKPQEHAFVLEQETEEIQKHQASFSMIQTAIFSGRVASIAERMGGMLLRLARSISIRERRDFSCAVFDPQGRLVANAPHVPVHLGSMGAQLRHFLRFAPMEEGEVWIGNDPYCGGAHLPDITAFSAVFYDSQLVAFVGCRGHHIDIGGIQPGSMPPHSRHIDEEGIRITRHRIFDGHDFHWPDLSASRKIADVRADLEGQVEACLYGVKLVIKLALEGDLKTGFAAMLSHARQASLRWLNDHQGVYDGEESSSGITIHTTLNIEPDHGFLTVDAAADGGNRNAPYGVLSACLLYLIRSSIHEEIPLNAGFLECWSLTSNRGGLFDPQYPRAVVGGNVETSQLLIDILQRSMKKQAYSQGTMNNLCISCGGEVLYETLGGGAGAGRDQDGGSAVQIHMTNTQATDIEVVEDRMPVRITRWSFRDESGGKGEFRGGDGMIKEWLMLADAEVSLLASRRDYGAKGCRGGESGLPGLDEYTVQGEWFVLKESVVILAGEKCRISTPGGGGFGGPTVQKEKDSPI